MPFNISNVVAVVLHASVDPVCCVESYLHQTKHNGTLWEQSIVAGNMKLVFRCRHKIKSMLLFFFFFLTPLHCGLSDTCYPELSSSTDYMFLLLESYFLDLHVFQQSKAKQNQSKIKYINEVKSSFIFLESWCCSVLLSERLITALCNRIPETFTNVRSNCELAFISWSSIDINPNNIKLWWLDRVLMVRN